MKQLQYVLCLVMPFLPWTTGLAEVPDYPEGKVADKKDATVHLAERENIAKSSFIEGEPGKGIYFEVNSVTVMAVVTFTADCCQDCKNKEIQMFNVDLETKVCTCFIRKQIIKPITTKGPEYLESGYCHNAVEVAPDSVFSCYEGGKKHIEGTHWLCSDGCNRCVCLSGGHVAKTNKASCIVSRSNKTEEDNTIMLSSCKEGGKYHSEGTAWICSDGCNSCSCLFGGKMAKTQSVSCKACTHGGIISSSPCLCGGTSCHEGNKCIDHMCLSAPNLKINNRAPVSSCKEGNATYRVGSYWICSDGCSQCACPSGNYLVINKTPECTVTTCNEGDKMHLGGTVWTCADGCNRCSCHNDGHLVMTKRVCPGTQKHKESNCDEGGISHAEGTIWTCSDECNECSCQAGQLVETRLEACSQIGMEPGPHHAYKVTTVEKIADIVNVTDYSTCCTLCKAKKAETQMFNWLKEYQGCYCYKKKTGEEPIIMAKKGHSHIPTVKMASGICDHTISKPTKQEEKLTGYFFIKSNVTDLVLTIMKGIRREGAMVHMWHKYGGPAQKWKWEGNFLASELNGLVLDVMGSLGPQRAAKIRMWPKYDSPSRNQKWKYDGGHLMALDKYLTIPEGEKNKGTVPYMWTRTDTTNQKWILNIL